MMVYICSVRDRVANTYGMPMFFQSIGTAIRAFGDAVNKQGSEDPIAKHPDDFDLYHLGTWDDAESDFAILAKPVQIAVGKSLAAPRS